MSQAGRYAHEQNKKRHNQGKSASGVLLMGDTIATAEWLSSSMSLCRSIHSCGHAKWNREHFAGVADVSAEEAERRLRYMSQLGFLRMSRNKTLSQFEWELDQPNLVK